MRKLQRFHAKLERRWGFDFALLDEVVNVQRKLPGILQDARDPQIDGLLRRLEYTALALAGEVGELANAVKKVRRQLLQGDTIQDVDWAKIQGEAADILAYLLKLCNLMGWDLETLYRQKMITNDRRFGKERNVSRSANMPKRVSSPPSRRRTRAQSEDT